MAEPEELSLLDEIIQSDTAGELSSSDLTVEEQIDRVLMFIHSDYGNQGSVPLNRFDRLTAEGDRFLTDESNELLSMFSNFAPNLRGDAYVSWAIVAETDVNQLQDYELALLAASHSDVAARMAMEANGGLWSAGIYREHVSDLNLNRLMTDQGVYVPDSRSTFEKATGGFANILEQDPKKRWTEQQRTEKMLQILGSGYLDIPKAYQDPDASRSMSEAWGWKAFATGTQVIGALGGLYSLRGGFPMWSPGNSARLPRVAEVAYRGRQGAEAWRSFLAKPGTQRFVPKLGKYLPGGTNRLANSGYHALDAATRDARSNVVMGPHARAVSAAAFRTGESPTGLLNRVGLGPTKSNLEDIMSHPVLRYGVSLGTMSLAFNNVENIGSNLFRPGTYAKWEGEKIAEQEAWEQETTLQAMGAEQVAAVKAEHRESQRVAAVEAATVEVTEAAERAAFDPSVAYRENLMESGLGTVTSFEDRAQQQSDLEVGLGTLDQVSVRATQRGSSYLVLLEQMIRDPEKYATPAQKWTLEMVRRERYGDAYRPGEKMQTRMTTPADRFQKPATLIFDDGTPVLEVADAGYAADGLMSGATTPESVEVEEAASETPKDWNTFLEGQLTDMGAIKVTEDVNEKNYLGEEGGYWSFFDPSTPDADKWLVPNTHVGVDDMQGWYTAQQQIFEQQEGGSDPYIGGYPDTVYEEGVAVEDQEPFLLYDFYTAGVGGIRTADESMQLDEIDAVLMQRAYNRPFLFREEEGVAPRYRASAKWDQIANMSAADIFYFQSGVRDAGWYAEGRKPPPPDAQSLTEPFQETRSFGRPQTPGMMSGEDQSILEDLMATANSEADATWRDVLDRSASMGRRNRRMYPTITNPVFKVPRAPYQAPEQYQSVPGPKSIADEVRERFVNKMGRKPHQWELDDMAEELTGYYGMRNEKLLALDRAAWEGDDPMLENEDMVAIEDPSRALRFDIDEKWAKEIEMREDRGANSKTFQAMLGATMGNRVGIGAATAATQLPNIGRPE